MSSELFEDWVREFNRKLGSFKRKIALIIDNCTAHVHVENLKWIELIFLPQTTRRITNCFKMAGEFSERKGKSA